MSQRLLSFGQARVKRSFSINKMSTMNLLPANPNSRRTIKKHIFSKGGVRNVNISKKMLNAVAMLNYKYKFDLEKKRRDKEKMEKRKLERDMTYHAIRGSRWSTKSQTEKKKRFLDWRGQHRRFNPDVSGISRFQYHSKIFEGAHHKTARWRQELRSETKLNALPI